MAVPDFDDAVIGAGLSPAAESALAEAGAHRGDPPRAMAALMRARALAPEHPAVLIALYRHHFYGHRLGPARDVARQALRLGALALGLPPVWRELPARPLPGARDAAAVRFLLFALKGLAYLSLRLGDEPEARDALRLLRALDPEDHVGAALLEQVRQRSLRRTDDDADADADTDGPADLPRGAAAWAALDAGLGRAPPTRETAHA